MMIQRLTKQQQRYLAIGLLAGVLLCVYILLVMPVLSIARDYQEQIDDLEFRLRRYQRIVASKDQLLAQVAQIQAQHDQSKHFSARETPALASADLQKFLKNTVVEAGGQLTSTQVLPPREDAQFIRIGISVRMSGTADALRGALYEIETARPLLIIENMTIRPVRGRRNRRTRRLEASDQLNVSLEVVGYMRSQQS